MFWIGATDPIGVKLHIIVLGALVKAPVQAGKNFRLVTDENLKIRRRVWMTLSELWLDTELEDSALNWIAGVLNKSGFSEQELSEIYLYELAPFLFWNSYSVAGVWDGFDPDWVYAQAQKRYLKRSSIRNSVLRIFKRPMTFACRDDWNKILEKVRALRRTEGSL